jgi:thiol-disulfide isomerase/thioredoxin
MRSSLVRIAGFLVVLLVGFGFDAAPARERQLGLALAPGDRAPLLEATSLQGRPMTIAWNKNSVSVVVFWATSCAPCLDEMSALQELQTRRGKDAIAVVGVLFDLASNAQAIDVAQSRGIGYTLLRGDVRLSDRWGGILAVPTSYLVTKDGRIARRYVGGAKELIDGIVRDAEALLEGRPLGTMVLPVDPEAISNP